MIVVTHEMGFARDVADARHLHGRTAESPKSGTPDEVFDHPQNEKTRAFLRSSFEKI